MTLSPKNTAGLTNYPQGFLSVLALKINLSTICIFTLFLVCPQCLGSPIYEVNGHLIRASRARATNFFSVRVDGCKSLILVTNNDRGIDHIEFTTDGTNSSVRYIFTTNQPAPHGVLNQASLILISGPVPPVTALLCYIWQAYASACYYVKTNTITEGMGFLDIDFQTRDLYLTANRELHDFQPYLPSSITEVFSSHFYYHDKNGNLVFAPITAKPSTIPITNSVFRSVSWTNIEGASIPLQFETVQYRPNAAHDGTKVAFVVEGYTDSVNTEIAATDFNLTPMSNSVVYNRRFIAPNMAAPTIAYLSKDGRVLTADELKTTQLYRTALLNMNFKKASPRDLGLIYTIFICTNCIAMLTYICWYLKRKGCRRE